MKLYSVPAVRNPQRYADAAFADVLRLPAFAALVNINDIMQHRMRELVRFFLMKCFLTHFFHVVITAGKAGNRGREKIVFHHIQTDGGMGSPGDHGAEFAAQ